VPTSNYSSIGVPRPIKQLFDGVKAKLSAGHNGRKVTAGETLEELVQHYSFDLGQADKIKALETQVAQLQGTITEMAVNYSKAAAIAASPTFVVQSRTTLDPVIPPPPPGFRLPAKKPGQQHDPLQLQLINELTVLFQSGGPKLVPVEEGKRLEAAERATKEQERLAKQTQEALVK